MESSSFAESSSSSSSPRLTSKRLPPVTDLESGYVSGTSSTAGSSGELPQVTLTQPHMKHLNRQLEKMTAMDRLRFVKVCFPNLYQSTAFGLTGLVSTDMLSKIESESPGSSPVDLIFLDTLYHFEETYALVEKVKERYPSVRIHTYTPKDANTTAEFEERYGAGLYDTAAELYDWIAKVEPQQRAYSELNVAAVLTGRRRSQGGERDKIGILEMDEETGIVKINPLVDWTFAQVKQYITENNVPYNELLDRGYKSVGDWHSTSPVSAGEDERAGRWKGQAKSECGIHNKKSRYAQYLEEMQRKAEEEQLAAALEKVEREQKAED
ncbi:phosphoadenosine phosphosulfate reductase [Annulohypoxylon truncatum]|uniref:phosphoadenosine phosphosulfate reductase n=1 Tax=Annulohypoxylon truncatum TaxID=327061 RepID=UPI002008DD03|nr:phosphoadenosine phosphosulfate reductase [Annulohypoxylon truncatum]KAI1212833.1 phosphoadenosine phosphosulfate reductase [Annulohypoxylon truncatum]